MADDLNYSTIVFGTSIPVVPKDAETDNVVYSEIKKTKKETLQSTPVTPGKISPVCEDVAFPRYTSYRKATVALGLLCILLLAGLTTMCVLNAKYLSKYTSILALYTNESMAHRMLQADKATLEKEKEELTAQRDQFENSLQLIQQFTNFPVSTYCTLTKNNVYCEPCMKDWIQNGSSCYLFWMDSGWRTWKDSQTYCAKNKGHLVVIDTPEEQEFIRQNTPFYYDDYHGYWIGLSKQNNLWIWSTGAELQNNGSWTPPNQPKDNCVLSVPVKADIYNWVVESCGMYNRFICEMKVMVWPSQM
ncbi:C-type lectin domain family 4 member A isoform X1 [Tachysurus fulvidraco]|uniref:C-type lectin domain family 4 member A isoform X1 n=1 Tax=Tachysurus fulvidraco TaxID=1234273 RepID=UPI001FED4400|nr:C-type lectin domain family 4 member A isoform X1 [Tachysurus fulvidraco]